MDTRDTFDIDGQTDWLAMASLTTNVAVAVSSFTSGVFVEANESFCRLFQRTRDEIVGHTAAELGMWPDAEQRQRLMEIVLRQGSISKFEARYRNRLGETGDVEVSARVVVRAGETFLVGFLTEVTDQREFIESLRATQARLDVVLRSWNVLVFRQDRELRITWLANPALGATEDELIGRTDEDIMGIEAAAPLVAIKRRVLDDRHAGASRRVGGQQGAPGLLRPGGRTRARRHRARGRHRLCRPRHHPTHDRTARVAARADECHSGAWPR